MNEIAYVKLNEVNPDDFIPILNHRKVRGHLIGHELFDANSVRAWIDAKMEVDSTEGCRVRAILYRGRLMGWCGIQFEGGDYEIAIVIGHEFWGLGRTVFRDMMGWAEELGHDEILIHFLHSRPEYGFLRKIARDVHESEILGEKFLSYRLPVK